MNDALVVLGALALVGGVGAAAWANAAIDDMGILRYAYQDEYDSYVTVQGLGALSAVVGLIFLVIGAVADNKPTTKDNRAIQAQYPISPSGTNFCSYCGRQIASDAVWCPGCGRSLKKQP